MPGTLSRKLAAILYADVAGYTYHTSMDEEGTHRRVMEMLDNVTSKINASGGTVLRYAGDAVLATFPSIVTAVDAGADIQTRIAHRNNDVADEERIQIRMGINLGDVIEDRGEVYGDGVNLAARLESASKHGGICISATAWEQCRGKCKVDFKDGGEHQFKNLGQPVCVYHWTPHSNTKDADNNSDEIPKHDRMSIAVLPFTNMSGDSEQEYFADGITEDIITELSRFRSLSVIARNSSFVFKGQSVDVKEIAGKLGVQYLVEGSVRKAGDRVRITAQLLDAKSGSHLWADRYDRKLEDIFDVQDEVVRVISGRIPGMLEHISAEFARRKAPGSATAIDLLFKGRWALHHTSEGTVPAIDSLEKSVALDENLAPAHAWLAYAYAFAIFTAGFDPEEATRKACEYADRAVTLDSNDPQVNATVAIAYALSGEYDRADAHSERASNSNPNDAHVAYSRGLVLSYLGRPHEGLPYFEHIGKIDPYAPDDIRNDGYCDCLFLLGEYEKMLEVYRRWPNLPQHLILVRSLALSMLGRLEEARSSVDEYNALELEKLTPSVFAKYHVRLAARPEEKEKWMDGYRKAGVLV